MTQSKCKRLQRAVRQVMDTTKYPFSAVGELTGELKGTTRCGPDSSLEVCSSGCSATQWAPSACAVWHW